MVASQSLAVDALRRPVSADPGKEALDHPAGLRAISTRIAVARATRSPA
jgi:hypothetical protein